MTLVPAPPTSPTEIEAQWKLAQRLCNTEFVPAAFRNKPENILAAILTGHEHGIGPMQALQSINVIQGKPTLAPELMRALVARAGHRVDTIDYSETVVTLKGTRADTGAEATVSWTMEDARRAKLTGKGAWQTYPRAMLLARATAELCRLLYPDIIAGLSYTEEELGGEPAIVAAPPVPTVAAPPLPNEIDAQPPAPAGPSEDGTGSTAPLPPVAPVPGPAPDCDGDLDSDPLNPSFDDEAVVEAEIVGDPSPVTQLPPGEKDPDDEEEGGQAAAVSTETVGGDGPTEPEPAAPSSSEDVWSARDWRTQAKARGVAQRALILAARDIATQKNLDLVPSKFDHLIHPEIAPELRVWLTLQGD